MNELLKLTNIKKIYKQGKRDVIALENISFSVSNGEMIAIMGPSGSGKSTLLHIIGGLDKATDGEIILNGKNIKDYSDDELTLFRRHNIGVVFQFFNLLNSLTAYENIALPLHIDGKNKKEIKERVEEVLNQVGIYHRKDHLPDEMSGGEMQRVAIGRALVANPPIILADEPTGNLDTKTGEDIFHLLQKINKENNTTIIVVTHNVENINYCKRLLKMKDGKIISDETI